MVTTLSMVVNLIWSLKSHCYVLQYATWLKVLQRLCWIIIDSHINKSTQKNKKGVNKLSKLLLFVFVDKAAKRAASMSWQASRVGVTWPMERNVIGWILFDVI